MHKEKEWWWKGQKTYVSSREEVANGSWSSFSSHTFCRLMDTWKLKVIFYNISSTAKYLLFISIFIHPIPQGLGWLDCTVLEPSCIIIIFPLKSSEATLANWETWFTHVCNRQSNKGMCTVHAIKNQQSFTYLLYWHCRKHNFFAIINSLPICIVCI